MSLAVYNVLLTALVVIAFPFAAMALILRPHYRIGLGQRLGRLPPDVIRLTRNTAPFWAPRALRWRTPRHSALLIRSERALSRHATAGFSTNHNGLSNSGRTVSRSRWGVLFPTRLSACESSRPQAYRATGILFHRNRDVAEYVSKPGPSANTNPPGERPLLQARTATLWPALPLSFVRSCRALPHAACRRRKTRNALLPLARTLNVFR